jgi:hypothetical protein
MRMNMGRFRGCYEHALRQRPALRGRAQLRFVISRDGSVSTARVDGLEHAPELAQCLAKKAYGLTFPQPEGGVVTVVYPLALTPSPVASAPRRHGYR